LIKACYTKFSLDTELDQTRQLTVVPAATTPKMSDAIVVPAIVVDAGDQTARRFLEFFAATIRNYLSHDFPRSEVESEVATRMPNKSWPTVTS